MWTLSCNVAIILVLRKGGNFIKESLLCSALPCGSSNVVSI